MTTQVHQLCGLRDAILQRSAILEQILAPWYQNYEQVSISRSQGDCVLEHVQYLIDDCADFRDLMSDLDESGQADLIRQHPALAKPPRPRRLYDQPAPELLTRSSLPSAHHTEQGLGIANVALADGVERINLPVFGALTANDDDTLVDVEDLLEKLATILDAATQLHAEHDLMAELMVSLRDLRKSLKEYRRTHSA